MQPKIDHAAFQNLLIILVQMRVLLCETLHLNLLSISTAWVGHLIIHKYGCVIYHLALTNNHSSLAHYVLQSAKTQT